MRPSAVVPSSSIIQPENVIVHVEAALWCWHQMEHLKRKTTDKNKLAYLTEMRNKDNTKTTIKDLKFKQTPPCRNIKRTLHSHHSLKYSNNKTHKIHFKRSHTNI
ncbi:hypothetical protein TorRG33x02_300950 [Trema orientale]|uniref:Uncharacterized protein n=1 Tax=Trema orientale TaxID=63057 RepID=A0A2P5C1T6_TREOI|nr:hypothetical protein TorRG33x02_300950 [Trema orientale]